MKKITQKEIKSLAAAGAVDLTLASFADVENVRKKHPDLIAISRGVYGVTGGAWIDADGVTYVIMSRSCALFQML